MSVGAIMPIRLMRVDVATTAIIASLSRQDLQFYQAGKVLDKKIIAKNETPIKLQTKVFPFIKIS